MAGIILTGGFSRRMGRDKALLPMPGAVSLTFVEYLASLLATICTQILLVARDQESGKEYLALSDRRLWQIVYDQIPGQGPLMGLYSGLLAASAEYALVLAVDLPCVQPALLAHLAAFPRSAELLIPYINSVPQVLLARYPRAVLPVIVDCLQQNRRDPRALLASAPVHYLLEDEIRLFDPDLRSFRNINTLLDFQTAWL